MFFVKTFREEVLHEEIYLIDRVELFKVFSVCGMLLSYLAEVSEPQTLDVLVFHDIV